MRGSARPPPSARALLGCVPFLGENVPCLCLPRVPLSLPIQLTDYLQVPPHSEEAMQAMIVEYV